VVTPAEAAEQTHLAVRGAVVTIDGRVQAAPAPRFGGTPTDPAHPLPGAPTTVSAVLEEWT
jgi:alpha-methylacyl-CoA racemase